MSYVLAPRNRRLRRLSTLAATALAAGACSWGAATTPTQSADALAFGTMLFFDRGLSADGTVSCATCHDPAKAFSDGRPVAIGIGGQAGVRNTPSLNNVSTHDSFFWDGRRDTLESQVVEPLVNPREHGLESLDQVVKKIEDNADYTIFLRDKTIKRDDIAIALATYVRSLGRGKSRFDRYWLDNEKAALTSEERMGFELFRGPGQCAGCHSIETDKAPFTDNKFHSLGVSREKLSGDLAEATLRSVRSSKPELERLVTSDPAIAALGRFNVTKRASDIGKYRTPSLRNVGVTAPYMHDGSVATLEEAVDTEIYYRSAQQGRPLILTSQQRRHIVAFLRALNSETLELQGKP